MASLPSPIHFSPHPQTIQTPSTIESERGMEFTTGGLFYRRESSAARDLAVLSAALLTRRAGRGIRVLDAMCGCGVRPARYLAQGGAGFVWANDAFEGCRAVISANLASVAARVEEGGRRNWVVTHLHANRLFSECYLRKEYFDLVDIDSFGGETSFLRSALNVVKIGGFVYLTSTDGRSSAGHRPSRSLSSYGAYVRPMPFSNEIGLRMLIGGAIREASALGFHVSPLFSYYSFHGPVFRVMLQLDKGKNHDLSQYSFVTYCKKCGHSQTFSWEELGQISCICGHEKVVVTGPVWTGPLHDEEYLGEMLELAKSWGWHCKSDDKSKCDDLNKLLNLMIDECDIRLPPGFISIDEIGRRAKLNTPALSTFINTLKSEGYAACRSHIDSTAIKTNCSMASCINYLTKLSKIKS
ncbi:hypothetical protein LUZ60_003906 [Juncus effusus]|nr:hypothetical protein LUZ60_003906 [Juncus effusus]